MEEILTILAEHDLQYKEFVRKAIEAARQMRVAEQRELHIGRCWTRN